MLSRSRLLMAVPLIFTLGCGPGFAPSSLVEELRVLGVRAEPAEVQPGDNFSYRALVANPQADGSPLIYTFVQCTLAGTGCLEYEEALERTQGDEAAAQVEYEKTSLRYGLDFGSATTIDALGANLRASETILDNSANVEEGSNGQGTFVVCLAEACAQEEAESLGGDSLLTIKRVRISLSEAPNHNPEIVALRYALLDADEEPVEAAGGGQIALPAGEAVTLTAVLPSSAVEAYDYLNDDGELEQREERPYVRWYATGGGFVDSVSSISVEAGAEEGLSEVVYMPPEADSWPEAGLTIYAVVWDRRGGLGWITINGVMGE